MKSTKNDMNNMIFKKFISYFNLTNSIKEIELNKILDKIAKKVKLSKEEAKFLDSYQDIEEEDIKNLMLLTCQTTFEKLKNLIDKNKKVICNLSDRDGKLGIQINSVYCDYEHESYYLNLKNNQQVLLKDNLFYNIIYILQKDLYSLETEDEFFEKISVKNAD
jgi:hypothetical protein